MYPCKKNILLPLILLCFLLSACSSNISTPSTIPPTESLPTETVPESLPFEFPLPPEYTAQYKSDNEISIVLDNQIIGGIIRTGFSSDCATEAKSEERRIYLTSLYSRPVREEYFTMLWDNHAYVSMSFENVETGETWAESHCLFAIGDISFDIWVDDALIDTEQRGILVDYVVNTHTQRISQNSIQQHLTISATKETEPGFYIHIPSEELGGNYSEDLVYFGFSNVQIDLNGTLHPLETAIRDGLISMEEIFAHARIDARNGFCQETSETNHGLTHFTYQYPDTEFKLRLTYDIYETPDGQSHLINEFLLLDTNASSTDNYHNEETGMLLDFENWGLDFEIISTSPNGITLRCTQSGGQQLGMLYPESYTLSRVIQQNEQDTLSYLTRVRLESTAPISSNDSSQITIDWPEEISELAPGRYSMCLYIKDVYDISAVHPLMENFHDIQGYWITFDIP